MLFFILSVCKGEGSSDDGDDYNDDSVSGGVGKGDLVEDDDDSIGGIDELDKIEHYHLRTNANFSFADNRSLQLQPTVNTEPLHQRHPFS